MKELKKVDVNSKWTLLKCPPNQFVDKHGSRGGGGEGSGNTSVCNSG